MPPSDTLCNIQGDVLESMIQQVIDDGSALSDRIDAISDRKPDTIIFTEEQSKNAHARVFKFYRIKSERGELETGAHWTAPYTGFEWSESVNMGLR
jgi:hypothetical protein